MFYLALSSWAGTPEGLAELSRSGKEWIVQNAGSVFFIIAVVSLVLGVGALWLARGYVKGFEWARRRGRTVAALAILVAVFGAIFLPPRIDAGSPFWTIVFNAIVIAYLGRAKVRAYFRLGR